MGYPQAPWHLQGSALFALHFIDTARAAAYLPPELSMIQALPGQTLGGVYFARYEPGSALEYSELIVVSALVHHRSQIGGWVSHIYVDNPNSVAGGREIWGLPKELATFSWQPDRITVQQGDTPLCSLQCSSGFHLWRQSAAAPSFSCLGTQLLRFWAEVEAEPSLLNAKIDVPAQSPLADLLTQQPVLTIGARDMRLQVKAPAPVR